MIVVSPAFPAISTCISAVLGLTGLYLLFIRSRRGIGPEPRCHHCDYILIGISSDRCPECGTRIDHELGAEHRRHQGKRRNILGFCLLMAAMGLLVLNKAWQWSQTVYWYQYYSTSRVMEDLIHGAGKPPPANAPWAWHISSRSFPPVPPPDLSSAALLEFQNREKVGKLSQDYRRKLDSLALAH